MKPFYLTKEKWLVGDVFYCEQKKVIMADKIHTLSYLKGQAKKLKRELGITHTQALEIIAKNNGHSNWIDCQRTLNKRVVSGTIQINEPTRISFTDWLKKHVNRNSPLGDLASAMTQDNSWPLYDNLESYVDYLHFKSAVMGATDALKRAWKSYNAYLVRKKLPVKAKARTKAPLSNINDPRKIVIIKNVVAIHINKRTVEKFSPGDKAWISWDGRKAIPVTIIKVLDNHYNFRVERPLKELGTKHTLFLDEVRSTPELACINKVTY